MKLFKVVFNRRRKGSIVIWQSSLDFSIKIWNLMYSNKRANLYNALSIILCSSIFELAFRFVETRRVMYIAAL